MLGGSPAAWSAASVSGWGPLTDAFRLVTVALAIASTSASEAAPAPAGGGRVALVVRTE